MNRDGFNRHRASGRPRGPGRPSAARDRRFRV